MDLYVVKQKINTFELTRSVAAALIGLCALRYSWVQGLAAATSLHLYPLHQQREDIQSKSYCTPDWRGGILFSGSV